MPKKEGLIYFLSLELENVRCFGPKQPLDLSDGHGNPARWTLLLGNNGMGKTTLLQCLAWMKYEEQEHESANNSKEVVLGPKLSGEENEVINGLIRNEAERLTLRAKFAQGRALQPSGKASSGSRDNITTGIAFSFEQGALHHFELLDKPRVKDLFGQNYWDPLIIGYGANRVMGRENTDREELEEPLGSRLEGETELYDAEEILITLDYARLKKDSEAERKLKKLQEILARVLPNISKPNDIVINPPRKFLKLSGPSGLCFNTFSGLVPFSALSLGHQTMAALTLDLAWRLFQHYSESKTPLSEPAIVLIDEIDLHLHPLWQRTLIDNLTNIFSGTQFIATAHSPLIVQAAAAQPANLAVLRREEGHVVIDQTLEAVRGWRVDQILTSDLFDLPGYGLDVKTEELLAQRKQILSQAKLTGADKKRLEELEAQIGFLPMMENPKYDQAMDIILRAAEKLGKEQL